MGCAYESWYGNRACRTSDRTLRVPTPSLSRVLAGLKDGAHIANLRDTQRPQVAKEALFASYHRPAAAGPLERSLLPTSAQLDKYLRHIVATRDPRGHVATLIGNRRQYPC